MYNTYYLFLILHQGHSTLFILVRAYTRWTFGFCLEIRLVFGILLSKKPRGAWCSHFAHDVLETSANP